MEIQLKQYSTERILLLVTDNTMGKVRMLHPSSGRDNFDVVSTQTADSTNAGQTSQATIENNNAAQAVDKKEVEEKTKNGINAATSSQSQKHQ